MTYEQMMIAMKGAGMEPTVHCRSEGDWYCSQSFDVCGDGVRRGEYGNGTDPKSAIEDCWNVVTNIPSDRYLHHALSNKAIRWNGFMWEDASHMRD